MHVCVYFLTRMCAQVYTYVGACACVNVVLGWRVSLSCSVLLPTHRNSPPTLSLELALGQR